MSACGNCGQQACTCAFQTGCAEGTCAVLTGNGRSYSPINFRPNNVPLPRPYGYLLRTQVQTFGSGSVQQPIIWQESRTSFEGGMISVLPTDRMTIPVDGYYIIVVHVTVGASPSSTGNDLVIIQKNNTTNLALYTGATDGPRSLVTIEDFVAGDYIQVLMSTATGGDTDVAPSDPDSAFFFTYPYLWAQWMRPL